jgi:hypothetical protein
MLNNIGHDFITNVPFFPERNVFLPKSVPPFLAVSFCHLSAMSAQKSAAVMSGVLVTWSVIPFVEIFAPSLLCLYLLVLGNNA